jgi:hypothetical protein
MASWPGSLDPRRPGSILMDHKIFCHQNFPYIDRGGGGGSPDMICQFDEFSPYFSGWGRGVGGRGMLGGEREGI